MRKRSWLLIALIYLTFAEVTTWFPVPDLALCLIDPPGRHQAADSDHKQYCPAFHTGIVATLYAADGFLERHDKSVIGGFTIVLAISTIGLWFATNMLWAAGERQFGLLAKTAAAQSRDMQASIAISREANRLALNNFVSAQRPWIAIEEATTSTLLSKTPFLALSISDTRLIVTIMLVLKNVGRTPAHNVGVTASLQFLSPNFATAQLDICQRALTERGNQAGVMIFPDKTYGGAWSAIAAHEDVVKATVRRGEQGFITPLIIGCITYDFPPDKMNCQTTFLYMVQKKGKPVRRANRDIRRQRR